MGLSKDVKISIATNAVAYELYAEDGRRKAEDGTIDCSLSEQSKARRIAKRVVEHLEGAEES